MKHLKEKNLTYLQHFKRASKLSLGLAYHSIICLIHALLPCFFEDKTSQWLNHITEKLRYPSYYYNTTLLKFNQIDKNDNMYYPYPKIYDPSQKEGVITNVSEDSIGGISKMVSHNPTDPWAYGTEEYLKKQPLV